GCRPPYVPGKSSLLLKDSSSDAKDQVAWKWSKGSATATPDFGAPMSTTGYALCLYQAGPALALTASAPAGGVCKKGKPCWKAGGTKGFKYDNANLIPQGIQKLTLQAGADGKAKIGVTGKGPLLHMPALATLTFPLVVQLQGTHGECWTATYASPVTQN